MKLAYRPISTIPDKYWRIDPSPGINMRQHYAGLAMQGLLASDVRYGPEVAAKEAPQFADALLKELEKN